MENEQIMYIIITHDFTANVLKCLDIIREIRKQILE